MEITNIELALSSTRVLQKNYVIQKLHFFWHTFVYLLWLVLTVTWVLSVSCFGSWL